MTQKAEALVYFPAGVDVLSIRFLNTDVFSACRHRALPGQRADRVSPPHEGLAQERPGDSVRARRGQQPADREAEAQGE